MSAHGITPAPDDASIELPGDVWDALLATGQRRDYRAGAWIFVEDDPPGPAFAVIEGMVRVEAARERLPLGLGTFGPGSLFGELAAIDAHPRSASAIATEATQVVAIDAPDVQPPARRPPFVHARHAPPPGRRAFA